MVYMDGGKDSSRELHSVYEWHTFVLSFGHGCVLGWGARPEQPHKNCTVCGLMDQNISSAFCPCCIVPVDRLSLSPACRAALKWRYPLAPLHSEPAERSGIAGAASLQPIS